MDVKKGPAAGSPKSGHSETPRASPEPDATKRVPTPAPGPPSAGWAPPVATPSSSAGVRAFEGGSGFSTGSRRIAPAPVSAPQLRVAPPGCPLPWAGAIPDSGLQPGDRGEPVAVLQRALAALGYLQPGAGASPSGELDGPTRFALQRFQGDAGLPQTGTFRDADRLALELASAGGREARDALVHGVLRSVRIPSELATALEPELKDALAEHFPSGGTTAAMAAFARGRVSAAARSSE